ncbi:MAG TPA: ATP-binding cassette domain-containing protein [Candidatus Polarisedimenticolaceae bacterium]|nr:ATP-binding cassette domain-containing protein [Candidatus Polarisedimenticolaceae bacterium]
MPQLLIDDVVKAYDATVAVDHVSFEVNGGEVFGLLGPNGAGKSTLIRMVMDILRPDAGRILVNGQPSTGADHDKVGYLPEERGLYRKQKVIDVLDYFGRLKGMKGPDVKAKAQAALDRMGLGEWAKKKVEALSKGMQQKVQIIGTLLHEPEIVVLDEPFTGLDPVNARVVKELIADLKRQGRLIVLSTHQMDQVEELCDRIVMIDRGKRVLYGTVRQIKRQYAEELRRTSGRANVVVVDGEGDFAGLPGVLSVEAVGGESRVTLDPGVSPETFLAHALGRGVSISRFEAAPTPLEEIFIHVVTTNGAAAA